MSHSFVGRREVRIKDKSISVVTNSLWAPSRRRGEKSRKVEGGERGEEGRRVEKRSRWWWSVVVGVSGVVLSVWDVVVGRFVCAVLCLVV